MATHKKGYKKPRKQLSVKQKAAIKRLEKLIDAKERQIGKYVLGKGGIDQNMVAKAQGYVAGIQAAIIEIKK